MTASSHGALCCLGRSLLYYFADASNRCGSRCVGEMEVAGCKLELANAAGVDAHAQQGHAP